MKFGVGLPFILLLLACQAWAGNLELYRALGSPAGRFLLAELGAGQQIAERWSMDAAAMTSDLDPTEELLERVRLRYLQENPGEASVFDETKQGPVALRAEQRLKLGSLLERESQTFFATERTRSARSYSLRRADFLADSPKQHWLRQSSFNASGNDETLALVRDEAVSRAAAGERATVVFDLDETGIDNRFGTAAMLLGREGWVQSAQSAAFPRARQALLALKVSEFRVTAEDLFAVAGISDEKDALKSVDDFLDERVHSAAKADAYGAPFPGFVEYVQGLHQAGVRVVYLTGRSASVQTSGTVDLLRFFGLPLDANAELFLKPTGMSTAEYKAAKLEKLIAKRSAHIVAVFDNEPGNLFEIQKRLPGNAHIVFVDTDFSKLPAQPASGWYRIRHW